MEDTMSLTHLGAKPTQDIATLNAQLAAGMTKFAPGTTVVDSTTGTLHTLKGVGSSAAFTAVDGAGNYSVTLPTGLGWDTTYPVSIRVARGRGASGLTIRSALTLLHPTWQTWPKIYVDVSLVPTGSGTQGSPYNSIGVAVQAANTAAVPAQVWVKGGTTAVRTKGFSAFVVSPTVDLVFVATGGRCVVGSHEAMTFAADATYTAAYRATRSSVNCVVDLLTRTTMGTYPRLQKVATEVICNRTPGSWWTDNVTVLVNRQDGAAVADANTRVYMTVENLRIAGVNPLTCVLLNETPADGWDLEGGGSSGCWRAQFTGLNGGRKVIQGADLNCTFRYGGGLTGANGNVSFDGLNGLVFFDSCDFSDGATDLFNLHNTVSGSATFGLTQNCTGAYAGQTAGYVSNNGWTTHEDVVAISLCDNYSFARGVTMHSINNTRSLIVAPKSGNSLGDKIAGGGNPPTEIKTQDTGKLWLVNPVFSGPAGNPRVRAEGTSTLSTQGVSDDDIYIGPTATASTF